MSERRHQMLGNQAGPVCDCGYQCQGDTLHDRVQDAQRHAREVHGIEVSAEQILKETRAI
jgi:predicted small metal-binding protein